MSRQKLPPTRKGRTVKVEVYAGQPHGTLDVYITVNAYPHNDKPAEVFVKLGAHDFPWLDQWCRAVSVLLQRGESLEKLVDLFGYTRFEPCGRTDYMVAGDNGKPRPLACTSLVDLVVRVMASLAQNASGPA